MGRRGRVCVRRDHEAHRAGRHLERASGPVRGARRGGLHEPVPLHVPLRLGGRRQVWAGGLDRRPRRDALEVLAQDQRERQGRALGLHAGRLRRQVRRRGVHLPRPLGRGPQRQRDPLRHRAHRGGDPARQAAPPGLPRGPLRRGRLPRRDLRRGAHGLPHSGRPLTAPGQQGLREALPPRGGDGGPALPKVRRGLGAAPDFQRQVHEAPTRGHSAPAAAGGHVDDIECGVHPPHPAGVCEVEAGGRRGWQGKLSLPG
mmetsp:Transcript_86623/g.269241  ORF Transcript_86623/g.269241 Transcript_86623/m.269241 type:complete len:258 (-) Transcript_86623:208-981(-)